jgi:nucleotide-binding universal stress UspA family protein
MEGLPIIVGVDGSEESKRALRWAADFGQLSGAPVRALTFWEYPATYGWPATYDDVDFEKRAQQSLDDTVREVLGEAASVTCEVRAGRPSQGLVSASEQAQLLVIGARGRGGFTELLLGSVSQQCVHHARCPVLVMRRQQD